MTTTQQQVEHACQNIARDLAAFVGDAQHVPELQRCLGGIQWLREQYRADKALLEPYLDKIKDLSRQVHEALAGARESLTAKYLEAAGAIAAWEGVREACRDALLELAASQNLERLDCAQGWVDVHRTRSISLPKVGTSQRDQLCVVITEADRWPQVGLPSAARLLKAIDEGLFNPQHAGEIARLCPIQTGSRLIGHPGGS